MAEMRRMTVADLVAELQKLPGNAQVGVAVGWAADTAHSEDEAGLIVRQSGERIVIEGWLSNCATNLEFEEEDTEEADGG